MTLGEVNRADAQGFVALLGGVFEHSPWVAERTWPKRPFISVERLFMCMRATTLDASPEERLALIRAHPELAGREAKAGEMTESSTGEQGRLGFLGLSSEEFQRMADLNRRYHGKFGFPCIIALRLHAARATVMEEMERRIDNEPEEEVRAALEQIAHIARGRLEKLFGEDKLAVS